MTGGKNGPARSAAERAYAWLLRLYPRAFRREFGDDMREFFRDQLRAERARRGRRFWRIGRLWLRVLPDLLTGAARERASAISAQYRDHRARRRRGPRPIRRGDPIMQTFLLDLRFAVRQLRVSPVSTAVAVLVIALGTGAVTTLFSAANGIALRPLPGATRPGELVEVQRAGRDGRGTISASYPYYRHLRDGTRTLSGLAAWTLMPLTVSAGGEGTAALGNLVTGNYFEVLGVRPALGRFFLPEEDRVPGARPVAVIGHGLWTRRFGGDPRIVGRKISINGHPFTVVGVAPRAFHGVYAVLATDVWVPIMMQGEVRGTGDLLSTPGNAWLEMFGRRRETAGREEVRAELATLSAAYAGKAEPADLARFAGAAVSPLGAVPADANGLLLGFLALLLAASGLVLAIACVNVAGMLLARAAARRREMQVRLALGAPRSRLVRQLLTESVALFGLGAAGGVLLAEVGTRLLERLPLPADVPLALELTPDLRVLGFALLTALVTGVAFGLAPALQGSRAELAGQLRSDAPGTGARRSRARNALVVAQLALSLLLLVAAGLFLRALDRGRRVDPGFDAAHVATAPFDTRTFGYGEPRGRQFYRDLKARLAARPGIEAVAFAQPLPLSGNTRASEFEIDGSESADRADTAGGRKTVIALAQVDPDYFRAVRIPLLAGRAFGDDDAAGQRRVAIVNQAFVRRFWPGGEAVGRTLHYDGNALTVVGVARDAKVSSLGEAPEPFLYLPLEQDWEAAQSLLVRSDDDPARVAAAIRDEVRALDAGLPRPQVTPLAAVTSVALLPQRVAALVTGLLGLVGLLLSAVGLYGVIAYSVGQRSREIGVRMALGATGGRVVGMVVREGMRFVALGLALGLALALAATWLMKPFLFGVSATDGATFAATAALLAAVAALASYLPARRATAEDPIAALRSE